MKLCGVFKNRGPSVEILFVAKLDLNQRQFPSEGNALPAELVACMTRNGWTTKIE